MPLHKYFQHLLNPLMDGYLPGSKLSSVEIFEETSSLPASPQSSNEDNDRFKLHIPFAGHTLVWEVRFDVFAPKQAPDFLFDDESFTLFLNVDIISENIPSLLKWNADNPYCLFEVVQQLLVLYTHYQLQCLTDVWLHLKEDVLKLKKDIGFKLSQIQVLQGGSQLIPNFSSCSTRPSEDTVSIALLGMEAQFEHESVAEEFRQFSLLFSLQEYGAETSHEYAADDKVILYMNPVLQLLLGDREDLIIPNYSRTQGLYGYVITFKELLLNTLNMVVSDIQKREDFHETMLFELEKLSTETENFTFKIIDFKPLDLSSSSYLLKNDWFSVILHAETTPSSKKPKISLRTVTTGSFNEVELEPSVPWDPQKILKNVLEKMLILKDNVCISFNPRVD